jgi:hypothetical protein
MNKKTKIEKQTVNIEGYPYSLDRLAGAVENLEDNRAAEFFEDTANKYSKKKYYEVAEKLYEVSRELFNLYQKNKKD